MQKNHFYYCKNSKIPRVPQVPNSAEKDAQTQSVCVCVWCARRPRPRPPTYLSLLLAAGDRPAAAAAALPEDALLEPDDLGDLADSRSRSLRSVLNDYSARAGHLR